ncbi:hypothetical protein SAMN05216456_0798 [Devosia crocina]|uniref:DUF2062 domain-containing protein n=1 Tax=Devosia crocina TaxID=429728 RepID=A0A1I7N4W5_9HYPH|nr:DUF2062 domain-containing protein [Devosia crocina]SFV29623.1 hypothetical protein SAMN05216456_0798 [Devosia crocina]
MAKNKIAQLWHKFWPRMGLRRYFTYLRTRIMRISASPHAIAAGVAAGAAISMFPLFGLHFVLGIVLAFLTGGSLLAAVIGTAWGNPLTFPFFMAAAYGIGDWMRGGGGVSPSEADQVSAVGQHIPHNVFSEELAALWPTFSTMMIGAIPLALIVYAIFYVVVRWLVTRFRAARAERLAARRTGH